jgi:hypothetical protein
MGEACGTQGKYGTYTTYYSENIKGTSFEAFRAVIFQVEVF